MNKFDDYIYYSKKKWLVMRGSSNHFSIQNQIYHSFSIIIIAAFVIFLPINLFLGLLVSALLCALAIAFQSILLYQSRYKGRLNLAILVSCLLSNIILCANYFYNSGIAGPTLIISAAILFLLLIVVPKQQMFKWFAINILLASAAVYIEYKFPQLIIGSYTTKANMFVDNLASYIIGIMLLYIGVAYIRASYDKEKQTVNDKALALEKLNYEKDKLFSIISHDLKTPLASIQQYLDLLTQMELDAEERKWLEANLLKATTNSLDLLNNLFAWCKTQMDGCDVNLQNLNLDNALKKPLNIMHHVAQNKKINLNVDIKKDVILIADTNMLQLVIRNLVHNAIKFTPQGGTVNIAANNLGNNCIITISDNGLGMDDIAQNDAFTVKIKSSFGTNNETGTGLGLVLCKEYTQLQNGKIWFTSKKNEGTVFNLEFPTQ
ncbi:MAG: sensor histidine kinase [Sphingobacteriales bacterium]|nr:MAG: sensor histidine kinase [Sphingobacteriales bacterium]